MYSTSTNTVSNMDTDASRSSQCNVETRRVSQLILDIITQHSLNKFDDSSERLAAGLNYFLDTIESFVVEKATIQTCLPAFPFKSANKDYKVLGTLPDKAEELALERLNSMCARVQNVYAPGARITIISDGITYNDLLCISDRETWAYGEALRRMACEKQFDYISFSRLQDLVKISLQEELREISYVANCTNFRRQLLNEFGRDDLDIDHEIATNPDTKLTYLGYRRFLESDLKLIFPLQEGRANKAYKRDVRYLAKQMLIRGYAFAAAVKNAFPKYLRLSIHESVGEHKVSLSLLNTKTGYTTPWHCSVALLSSGEWISAPMGELQRDSRLELIHENGRPSYFKEKPSTGNASISDDVLVSYLQSPKRFSGYSSPSNVSTLSGRSTPSEISPKLDALMESSISTLDSTKQNTLSSSPYGRRLIPKIMDELAISDPSRVVFSLTKACKDKLEFRDISAQQFVEAVDKAAWWLLDQVGKPAHIQPVGYIGPHDLRHVLLTYACAKVGYAALFLSPKNSTEGAKAVLDALDCQIWVQPGETASIPLVKDFLRQRTMTVLQLPLLDDLLDCSTTKPFPYIKTFEEASNDPFCFLHTSGTTGVPKPIPWSHALIGTMDAVRLLPPMEGDDGLLPWTADWKDGNTIYSSFPMSHGAGIIMDILMPALFNLRCILGPAGVLPNINLVESLAKHAKIDIWSMVPSLVDELGETPDVLEKLRPSRFICASGGPVSPVSANKVNDVIRVLNLTGTTEGLFIGNLIVPREDWFWFAFHPYSGFEFQEIEPGTYEHWVHRNENWPLFQGIFHTFPEKESINFKDLYTRHPTKPNLWAFKGRSDDLVVLSNGYKISPLETEAFITTHPAIQGCLVIGTGRPQAALLVELKDGTEKTEDLLDSIWSTVQKANSQSRHTNQLLKDFVTFSDSQYPFIRTDKGTIKRPATLALYEDYIERFYSSRNDEVPSVSVDIGSIESIQHCLREVIASSFPELLSVSLDEDLFHLGLDSLGVFAVVKAVRAATGLGDLLAPRHLYANTTISKFSVAIANLAADARIASEAPKDQSISAQTRNMLAQHQLRQTFKLNAFDYVNPNHYMGLMFYFPLNEGVSFDDVYQNLQKGLNRTLDLIPALGGKMMNCSEQEIGYTPGDLCVTIPSLSNSDTVHNRIAYKDLSSSLPSFSDLRDAGFVPSAFRDADVLPDSPFPEMPADILVAQANFVNGGCILAVDMSHCCLDGVGAIIAMKVWAENCRFLQGDAKANCEWFDPDSFNHSLPEAIHEQEGWKRDISEIDQSAWEFLPFHRLAEDGKSEAGRLPSYPVHSVWPLPRAPKVLNTTLFSITSEKLSKLMQEVTQNATPEESSVSVSDVVQAFFWRCALRARYRVATEIHGEAFPPEEMSILESPTDGRPYFSSSMPSTYMGSMLIMSRSSMSLDRLCSPATSIATIASTLRETASKVTPSLVHDAFTILQSLPDHSKFSTANMGLDHMHAMISNMILFQMEELRFGDKLFGNGGSPETMRPQLERGNGRFRFLVVLPMKQDGSVELVLGTFPEELDMLRKDEQFMKYATLADIS